MDSKTPNRADAGMCLKCRRRCKQGEQEVIRWYVEKLRSVCTVYGDLDNYKAVYAWVRMKDNVKLGLMMDNAIWQEAFCAVARKLLNSPVTPEDVDAMGIELKTVSVRDIMRYNMSIAEEKISGFNYMWG